MPRSSPLTPTLPQPQGGGDDQRLIKQVAGEYFMGPSAPPRPSCPFLCLGWTLCLLFLLALSLMLIILVAMETVMSLAREGSMTSKSTVYSMA